MARLSRRIKLMIAGRSARAVLRGAADPTYPGAPNDIIVSNLTIIENDPNGLIAYIYGVSGELPHTFSLTADASSILQIQNGNELHKNGTPSGPGEFSFSINLLDHEGQEYSETFSLEILDAAEPPYDPGIDDETNVEEPPPSVDDDGFEQSIVQASTQDGLKMSGRNGGTTSFLKDWGVPEAGKAYKMKYSADWSGMSKLGRKAAVGFGFKSGDNFHMAGLRGNGAEPTTTMLASKIYGDFNKGKNHTVTNDGNAQNGTRNGPNWLQITIGAGGDTYTLESSADGETWDLEYEDDLPTPLSNATDALQFGPAGYFASDDKGVFVITIEEFGLGLEPPINTSLPIITGVVESTRTIQTTNGSWDVTPDSYSYQWKANGVNISGATASSYTLTDSDVGDTITCQVTATNGGGSTAATSAGVGPVLGDVAWSNVVLLLDFEGSDGATSTTDESPTTPHTVTFVNQAQIDTGVAPPYGTSSCLFDGTNDQLTIPDNDDWNFGAGHYTVEAFVRPASFANTGIILGQWNSLSSNISWVLGVSSLGNAFFYTSTTGSAASVNFDLEGGSLILNQWHHVAASYDGTTMRLYLDGALVDYSVVSRTLPNGTFQLSIGLNSSDGLNDFNGHLKGIRVTKGYARYTENTLLVPNGYSKVASAGTPIARTSQVYAEALHKGNANARVSQVYAETLHSGSPAARASQVYAEALHAGSPAARTSQVYAEVLRTTADE